MGETVELHPSSNLGGMGWLYMLCAIMRCSIINLVIDFNVLILKYELHLTIRGLYWVCNKLVTSTCYKLYTGVQEEEPKAVKMSALLK